MLLPHSFVSHISSLDVIRTNRIKCQKCHVYYYVCYKVIFLFKLKSTLPFRQIKIAYNLNLVQCFFQEKTIDFLSYQSIRSVSFPLQITLNFIVNHFNTCPVFSLPVHLNHQWLTLYQSNHQLLRFCSQDAKDRYRKDKHTKSATLQIHESTIYWGGGG